MKLKIAVPYLLAMLGVRKWLAERVFHAPESWLPTLCAVTGLTPDQWRRVEAALVALIYDGIPRVEV